MTRGNALEAWTPTFAGAAELLRTCLESHAEANPQNFRRQPEAGPPRAEKPYAWPEPISAILPPATSTVRHKTEEQERRRARCGTVSLKRQRHWGERAGPFGLRPARRIASLLPSPCRSLGVAQVGAVERPLSPRRALRSDVRDGNAGWKDCRNGFPNRIGIRLIQLLEKDEVNHVEFPRQEP
jgi:hypothetical protein